MSAGLQWEDPPAARTRGRDWSVVAAELRASPGRWAVLDVGTRQTATDVKRGRFAGMSVGEFEAVIRKTDDGLKLYVRYVGAQS